MFVVVTFGYASIHLASITSPGLEDYAIAKYGQVAAAPSAGSFVGWLYYLSPYFRLFEFVLGALTAALFMAMREEPVSRREAACGNALLALAIAAITVVYLALFTPANWLAELLVFRDADIMGMYFTFAPFMAALLFCCARYKSWIASLLSRPEVILCGEASYSIYLIHMMVIEHMKIFDQLANMPPSRLHGAATVLTTMLIVISVSLVTYRVIEVPARRALRRLLTLRPNAAPFAEVRLGTLAE
jgi:peptidoglycan/LPS O-acetylase OafA/YrhL